MKFCSSGRMSNIKPLPDSNAVVIKILRMGEQATHEEGQ